MKIWLAETACKCVQTDTLGQLNILFAAKCTEYKVIGMKQEGKEEIYNTLAELFLTNSKSYPKVQSGQGQTTAEHFCLARSFLQRSEIQPSEFA